MKFLCVMAAAVFLAGCTSLEKQQSNERAQVEIVKVQREAMARDVANQTQAEIAMYESLAQIAANSPESSDAIVLAIAMVANNRSKDEGQPGIVTLREQKNEAVELTKALAPTVGGLLTQVGIAALSQQTQREQIRATRDVQVNQANNTAAAIDSVATLGGIAASNAGDSITVTDSGFYNAGEYNQDSGNVTTTQTTTSIADAYNTTDNSVTDNSVMTTTTNDTVTYAGQEMTLQSLLDFLQGTGRAYSLTLGDTVYTVNPDSGEPVQIDCGAPDFSPAPPVCG